MSKFTTPAVIGTAAVLGAGLAVGVDALTGSDGGSTKTVTVQSSPLANTAKVSNSGNGLSAREIYEKDGPGVVQIEADGVSSDNTSIFGSSGAGRSSGSGFVIDKDGTIITNEHVIDGADKVAVTFSDDKKVEAKVIGADASNDFAVLKVDPKGLDLKPLELGTTEGVEVGDAVVAIGNPYGLNRTLTTGVISAKQREIEAPDGFKIQNVLQTDAAINPGNSGGPLLDAQGKVIGINSQIATSGSSDGSVGIGFAVPIDTVQKLLPEVKKNGSVARAYLGVSTIVLGKDLGDSFRVKSVDGALIQDVTKGSPAEKAGLEIGNYKIDVGGGEPLRIGGDAIVAVDGKKIAKNTDLTNLISAKKPGDKVELTVQRNGKERKVKVELGKRPPQSAASSNSPESQGGLGGLVP